MRLSPAEVSSIKSAVAAEDQHAKIFLFGSRVHDSKRGGDIDLLIDSDKIGFPEKIKILSALFLSLGEQKIDIVIKQQAKCDFVEHVMKDAILL